MRLRTRTFAVVTAAGLATGGISWAVMQATVTGSSVIATSPAQLRELQLTVDTKDIDPITLTGVTVPIIALNEGTTTLVLPPDSLAAPVLKVFKNNAIAGPCNPDSFSVGVPVGYTGAEVQPNDTAIVAYLPVTFHNLGEPQNACQGATLRFTWPTQTVG